MKNLKLYITTLIIVLFVTINSTAQVGIGTTTPDASSMLDIQSPDNNKGVLVPRMNSTLRAAIPSPANGLLVFDTETKSFWYYNVDTWKELVGEATLSDTDGDTKVEVEKVTDTDPNGDEINFTTRGAERMKIDANGVVFMGDSISGNYTKVTTDGSLSYIGNATRWDDLKVPVNSVKIKNTTEGAAWGSFLGNTLLLWFKNQSDQNKESDIVFTVQMPHGWKEGTKIYPHVHWTAKDGAPMATRVAWGLEYTWVKVGEVFGATTTITGNTVAAPNTGDIANYEHVITRIGTDGINGDGKTLSSMLVCRLFRNSSDSANDTYTGEAGLLEIDFHYQIDSDGSNEEYTKW